MMISTKGRYALRIMIDLAQHQEDGYISIKQISERQEISLKYLELIIATLNKADFVVSLRGKNGGYKLSRKPGEYTVGSILKLTEGGLVPVNCLSCNSADGCKRSDHCLTLPLWTKLDEMIDSYLEGITLEDVINKNC